ncbi:cobalamin synthase [Micromonospora luteifusca]|uniref:Cobalamin synthase n=1 Tax=Micromonospora luteifusca TaxID=709860 RepID=A0ABS2M1M3_9ACTN|nr:hypothetical protein [Micromonospora luteifusca]MBM7494358.1 cobalamin synthase [Micromonospora luteifusca]
MGPAPAEEQEPLSRSNVAERQIVAPWWYYAVIGIVAGAAVAATALLPQQIAGPLLVVAALFVGVTSRIAARAAGTRLPIPASAVGVGYLVALAVALIGSLIVAWTVVRPDGPSWLAWMLAALVFVVALSGTWVAKTGRTAQA